MSPLRDVVIIGVHPVRLSGVHFNELVAMLWGPNLTGAALQDARRHTWDQVEKLHLIEVVIGPPDADVEWGDFVQPSASIPEDNWQVAYDEQELDGAPGRWVFFLHDVDFNAPLATPAGDRALPAPTPVPNHLRHIEYGPP